MATKPLPRRLGAGLLGLIGVIWAALRKGDEVAGIGAMVSSAPFQALYGLVAEWGWIPLCALAVGVLLWGDPRLWPVWQRQRSDYMTLADAVKYVGERSVWARSCPLKMSEWNTSLPRDMRDALCLGHVRATGRPSKNGGHSRQNDNARVPIVQTFWETAWFQAIPNVMEYGETTDVVYVHNGGVKAAYIDVQLHRKDVRKTWPPFLPWERVESSITRVRTGQSDE